MTPIESMKLAISEGSYGLGRVHPNPPVGCVVLDSQNQLIATGRHERFGGDHAEINALKKIKADALKGSKWFVTLEPCAHAGKTPSCAKKLATLPISEVTYGLLDPNPQVSGQGAQILNAAGIRTQKFIELQNELEELCESFLWNMRMKKPFVALKTATSIDGQIAHRSGESQWVTGEAARLHSHFLRACFDAVAVGKETVLRDRPALDIRHPDFTRTTNKVIIFDSHGESLQEDIRLFQIRDRQNIFCIGLEKSKAKEKSKNLGIQFVPSEQGLAAALAELYGRGVHSIYVEGGARLQASFLKEGLVQRVYQFMAPTIIGAESGLSWTGGLSISEFSKRIQFKNVTWKQIGQDMLFSGRL